MTCLLAFTCLRLEAARKRVAIAATGLLRRALLHSAHALLSIEPRQLGQVHANRGRLAVPNHADADAAGVVHTQEVGQVARAADPLTVDRDNSVPLFKAEPAAKAPLADVRDGQIPR